MSFSILKLKYDLATKADVMIEEEKQQTKAQIRRIEYIRRRKARQDSDK